MGWDGIGYDEICVSLHILFFFSADSNPVTPYSNTQPSISPPPYSPLTPLNFMNKKSTDNNLQGKMILLTL